MAGSFPQEIYDDVISHLKDDPATLKATALACFSLLAVSQKHLFSRVALYPPLASVTTTSFVPERRPISSRFKQVLAESPHIGRYVEHLVLFVYADRYQWAGWTSSLEFCLEHLSRVQTLVLKFNQRSTWSNGFSVRVVVDPQGIDRIMQAFTHIAELPSLSHLDTFRLDISNSALLSQCRHLRELTLSKPIMPLYLGDAGLEKRGDSDLVFLDVLRLDTSWEGNDRQVMIRDVLLSQSVSLAKLKRLSRIAWGFGDGLFTAELWHIMEECWETLESLEIQAHFSVQDYHSIDWVKFRLPSLRVLHLHLYSQDLSATRDDLQSFITALIDLCFPLHNPSNTSYPTSELECLILTEHNIHWDHLHIRNFLVKILSDQIRFPKFRKLSWDACNATARNQRDHAFSNATGALPFEVEVGPGTLWTEITQPFLNL